MKKTTTLEEMHFGRRDGPGMTMRVLEKGAGWDPGATFHKIEFDTGALASFGVSLGTAKMTRLMGEALIRTADRMDAQPSAGGRYSLFRDEDLIQTVRMRGGLRMRPVYQKTIVQNLHDTGRRLLGIDWMDDEDFVVRFETVPSDAYPRYACGSTESEPTFAEDEIGMTLEQVTKHRLAQGLPDPDFVTTKYHPEITTIQTRFVAPGVDPADLTYIGIERRTSPLLLAQPAMSLAFIQEVADIAEAGDDQLIRTAIGTFYALPFLRRQPEARKYFAERLALNIFKPLEETRELIRRVKAD